MLKKNNEKKLASERFLLGVVSGIIFGGGLMFFFGTKKGRQFLRRLIEIAENIESYLEEFFSSKKGEIEEKKKNEIVPNYSSIKVILERIKNSFSSLK